MAGSTWTVRIRRVLTSTPSAGTPMPWPVAWTPTESPAAAAYRTAATTSDSVRAPTTSRGRWVTIRL